MAQPRERRSYKSKAQQARVLAKKIAGKSSDRIAREEGIARNTVRSILKASQYQAVMRAYRSEELCC